MERAPDAAKHIKMGEVDRRSFLAQFETLRDQALKLNTVAGMADAEEMRNTLAAISSTCNSSHECFHYFPGAIEGR